MRGLGAILSAFGVVGLLLGGCEGTSGLASSGGPGDADLDVSSESTTDAGSSDVAVEASIEERCAKVAQARCARLVACAPATLTARYGGPATCIDSETTACKIIASLPGSRSAATLDECASEVEAADCLTVIRGVERPSCLPAGTLPNTDPCVADQQCSSKLCDGKGANGCGSCAPRKGGNSTCTSTEQCVLGLVCGQTCNLPVGPGGTCSATAICSPELFCGMDQKCAPYAKENEPCPGIPCDPTQSLSCIAGVCVKQTYAAPGAPCTNTAGCAGGICRPLNNVPTCTAFAKLGDACSAIPCLRPGLCVAGQCVLPSPLFCAK